MNLNLFSVTLVIVFMVGCGGTIAPPCPDASTPSDSDQFVGSCDLTAHRWQQADPNSVCLSSYWTFTHRSTHTWSAVEVGCGNARGVGSYEDGKLILDIVFYNGSARYTWPLDASCHSGPGTLDVLEGPLQGKSYPSTLTIAD